MYEDENRVIFECINEFLENLEKEHKNKTIIINETVEQYFGEEKNSPDIDPKRYERTKEEAIERVIESNTPRGEMIESGVATRLEGDCNEGFRCPNCGYSPLCHKDEVFFNTPDELKEHEALCIKCGAVYRLDVMAQRVDKEKGDGG